MRPDSVAGGAACVIAALGLLAASYMSLMVPYSAVEVGVCTQDYFAIRANAPCKGEEPVAAVSGLSTTGAGGTRGAAVASSGPLPGVGGACHRLLVQVTVVPVYDGEPDELGSFKASVTPAAGVACTSQAECMAVLQGMNKTFDCYVPPSDDDDAPAVAYAGVPPTSLLEEGQPGWQSHVAFGFLVLVPIPFCLFMGCFLMYSGITETSPLASFMARYSCDMKGGKAGAHVL